MRIGTENCPRRVGSDDLKPLTTICEEGVENKRYTRASQEGRTTQVEVVRRGLFSNKPSTTGSPK